MTSILLTAIGGDIAQGAAIILRETYPDWHCIGADIAVRHAGVLYVDELLVAPRADDFNYLPWLSAHLAGVDLCWPLSEPEISKLSQQSTDTNSHTKIILPGAEVVAAGNDKFATAQILAKLGLKGPWTYLTSMELSVGDFPCVYKPRSGSGSRAVFICKNLVDARVLEETFPDGVYQELLLPADREVTCAVYRSRDGRVAVLPLLRQLAGGLTGWAQVIESREITNDCTLLAEALDLRGCMNVQLRLTDGGPRIFEINARLSSTALIRHKMGFTDVVWSVQEMLGELAQFKMPATGTTGVRTFSAQLTEGF